MSDTDLLICPKRFQKKMQTNMTQHQIILVQKTWRLLRGIKPEIIGDVFYSKLFTELPAAKRMFTGSMNNQYKKFIDMLSVIVGRLNNLEELTEDIKEMAKRHAGYGVKAEHYKIVGDALLWTLQQGLGPDWDNEVKEAWATCYQMLADTMIAASEY